MRPGAYFLQGDAAALPLADASVQCVVTSPPYWGLRDYGTDLRVWGGAPGCAHEWGDSARLSQRNRNGQGGTLDGGTPPGMLHPSSGTFCPCGAWRGDLGLEPTPELYVSHMVAVFREVRRVLRADGTVWCNLGDAFKDKQLLGLPWRVAFALQADGWWLRSDIIWSKPNPMPESVTDRPTKAHEYLFLLTKRATYFYDAEAIKEPLTEGSLERGYKGGPSSKANGLEVEVRQFSTREYVPAGRNRRSVWTIATEPYPLAHFATFPEKLVEPCILAGTSERGACPTCGAPWARVVARTAGDAETTQRPKQTAGMWDQTSTLSLSGNGSREWAERGTKTATTGWAPPCACPPAEPVPCRVLDPFAGSGTTVAVAERLGRVGIGVELKPAYLDLARQRTGQAGLL